MLQKEQSFDTKEIVREMVQVPFRLRTYNILRKFLIGFILISIANLLFSSLFYTPKAYSIHLENQELIAKYKILEGRIAAAGSKLEEIKHRDKYIYRSLFGVDTTSLFDAAHILYPQSKYGALQGDSYSSLMTSTWLNMDQFARMLYAQSTSLDELQMLANNKKGLEAAIPAIWPIDRTRFQDRSIGAFGMRKHPIYNRYIMHKGVDFGGTKGDPIYATGDAVVEFTEYGQRSKGYGQQILLNHEFGYKTRYAHLSKRLVQKGDTVRRGDIIGEMGNTGGSVSSHLHYEVIYKGNVVNPVNYFNRNMTNDEYREIIEQLQDTKFDKFDE
ncbi:MAG: M23 family metallopeptidase [Rikenellaceae bacterium]